MKTEPNDNALPTTGNGPTDGLTKRELLAAMAMQGLLAWSNRENQPMDYAVDSVRQADNLIAALNTSKT